MLRRLSALVFGISAFFGSSVHALPVQFDYYGAQGSVSASGYLVIDDSLFNGGGFQGIAQSNLLDFSLTQTNASTTFTWGFADLVSTSVWYFDSSATTPDIVGHGGYISLLNSLAASGTGAVGSSLGTVGHGFGDWTYAGTIAPVPVPVPFVLLLSSLAGLSLFARRKRLTLSTHR